MLLSVQNTTGPIMVKHSQRRNNQLTGTALSGLYEELRKCLEDMVGPPGFEPGTYRL